MTSIRRRTVLPLLLATFASLTRVAPLALAGAAACRSEEAGAPVRLYSVRAEVVQAPAQPGARELTVRHEAIDAFVDETGKVVGMDAMTMRFAVSPGVSLEGVRAGDKVEVALAVGFSPPTLRIDRLRKLPHDTVLSFGKARPPAARP